MRMKRFAALPAPGLLAAALACGADQGPSSPISPSATPTVGLGAGGGGLPAAAPPCKSDDAAELKLCAPTPLSPANGAIAAQRPVMLEVANPRARFVEVPAALGGAAFRITFEVSAPSGPPRTETVAAGAETTRYEVPDDFWRRDTAYRWRARAALGDETGPWSPTFRFSTPAGFLPGSSRNAPFTTPGGDPGDLRRVVRQAAHEHPGDLANACPEEGGSWTFLDRVVERLRAIDGRWGYNCKRGDCRHVSVDVVDYYRGPGTGLADAQGSTDVAIFDVILKVCGYGADPQPTWIDQTESTRKAGAVGRWKYPRE